MYQDHSQLKLLTISTYLVERFTVKDLMQRSLQTRPINGYSSVKTLEAHTADSGLEFLQKEPVDVVVCDVNFNVLNPRNQQGLTEFLLPLRRQGIQTPVVCWADPMYKEETLRSGATAFVSKPSTDGLVEAIYSALGYRSNTDKSILAKQ